MKVLAEAQFIEKRRVKGGVATDFVVIHTIGIIDLSSMLKLRVFGDSLIFTNCGPPRRLISFLPPPFADRLWPFPLLQASRLISKPRRGQSQNSGRRKRTRWRRGSTNWMGARKESICRVGESPVTKGEGATEKDVHVALLEATNRGFDGREG
jgi:hypothetical protein